MIKTGDDCPVFEAINQYGDLFKIKDLIGTKNAVVVFLTKKEKPGGSKKIYCFGVKFI